MAPMYDFRLASLFLTWPWCSISWCVLKETFENLNFHNVAFSQGFKSLRWLSFHFKIKNIMWFWSPWTSYFCFFQATDKLPTSADLSNCHLEFLPETIFINDQLAMLNLRHNVLKERPIEEDIYTIGWIDDLPRYMLYILELIFWWTERVLHADG